MDGLFYEDTIERESNLKGVLLATTRFKNALLPWVSKNTVQRLPYVDHEVSRIASECAAEVGADRDYVESRLRQYIAEAVAVSEPEKMDLEDRGEASPPEKFDPAPVNPEPDAVTDVHEHEPVLVDEILEPDATIDITESITSSIADEESWDPCFRCGKKVNPVVRLASPVCTACTDELRALAQSPLAPPVPPGALQPADQDPNEQVICTYCQEAGIRFSGTREQLEQHVLQHHAQDMREDQAAALQQTAAGDSPVTSFDSNVANIANKAAAKHYSQPTDEDIDRLSNDLGLDREDVRSNLRVIAQFGEFVGVNGGLTDVEGIDAAVEEGAQSVGEGGRVESHTAVVPVDLALTKTADDLNLDAESLRAMVSESYGNELSDEYYYSVSGERRFYLPTELLNSEPVAPEVQAPSMPPSQQAPAAPPSLPVSKLVIKERPTLKELFSQQRRDSERRRAELLARQ